MIYCGVVGYLSMDVVGEGLFHVCGLCIASSSSHVSGYYCSPHISGACSWGTFGGAYAVSLLACSGAWGSGGLVQSSLNVEFPGFRFRDLMTEVN